jgi:RimJ/RimL family protein N-acetyltransferase
MVTLREVTGDREELAALQRVMESDEDRAHQGQGIGAAACRALERDLLPRWPWARRLRLGVVGANHQTLGFWRRLGFTETGEVRPWRYDKLESESILMDKVITARRGGGPGPAGGRGGGAR